MILKRFTVVTAKGHLRTRGGYGSAASLYDTAGKAQNQCRCDGDSVVAVDIDLTREPVFIRRRVIRE